jgi:hypothetical protein
MEGTSTQQVDVKMKDRLSGARSRIDDRPVAFGIQSMLARQLRRHGEEMPQEGFVRGRGLPERRQVLARNHQEMNERLRVYVFDGRDLVVFVNELRRRAAVEDSAEQAMFQINLNLQPAES